MNSFVNLEAVLERNPSDNNVLDVMSDTLAGLRSKNEQDVALEFANNLSTFFVEGKDAEMAFLVGPAFEKISKELYSGKDWPKLTSIKEFSKMNKIAQKLYTYLSKRHVFYSGEQSEIRHAIINYSNNQELLKYDFTRTLDQFNSLPAGLIWNLLDDFVEDMYRFCRFRKNLEDSINSNYKIIIENNEVQNLPEVLALLDGYIERSTVLKDGKFVAVVDVQTHHYFGYFAFVSKIKLYINHGMF